MNKEVKQYVEIFYPGIICPESSINEVLERKNYSKIIYYGQRKTA